MALKKTLTDPLNWILLFLALAFGYYIIAVPYFTELYLKSPQEMTLEEYLGNPSHPREFMMHALSVPPASIQVIINDLTVMHIDQDSILLSGDLTGSSTDTSSAVTTNSSTSLDSEPDSTAPEPSDDEQSSGDEVDELPLMVNETPVPLNEIMIPGDNLDLGPFTVGQKVSLLVFGLHESPLGWVPLEPTVAREQEEFFNKDELDELDLLHLLADGLDERYTYIETGELRFAQGVQSAGQWVTLEELANDTTYIQTVNRLAGAAADLRSVRVVERRTQDRAQFFIVEDFDGRRARVYYNPRLLSEWYWALDRLGESEAVIRATLRALPPADLRMLEAESNIQAVMDGMAILSADGTKVFNLENPIAAFGS